MKIHFRLPDETKLLDGQPRSNVIQNPREYWLVNMANRVVRIFKFPQKRKKDEDEFCVDCLIGIRDEIDKLINGEWVNPFKFDDLNCTCKHGISYHYSMDEEGRLEIFDKPCSICDCKDYIAVSGKEVTVGFELYLNSEPSLDLPFGL